MNQIICGDAIEELKKLPENSVDTIITDPPYGLGFMNKEWDNPDKEKELIERETKRAEQRFKEGKSPTTAPFTKSVRPGMPIKGAKEGRWFQEWFQQVSDECLRVLKPGGYFLSFGATRMYHRLVCGIEDAGFEIRDTIMWLYGSGFPKSLNIGKQIDKRRDYKAITKFCKKIKEARLKLGLTKHQAFLKCNMKAKTFGGNSWFEDGRLPSKEDYILLKEGLNLNELDDLYDLAFEEAEREVIGQRKSNAQDQHKWLGEKYEGHKEGIVDITLPATPEAKEWEGWGTALKPACEPIVVARKPLSEKNVALNVLKWGTGGINVDESRIGNEQIESGRRNRQPEKDWGMKPNEGGINQGRFPANIILDEESAKMLDEQSGDVTQGHWSKTITKGFGDFGGGSSEYFGVGEKDKTKHGASRFFYVAKASKSERNFGCENLEEQKQDESRKEGNPGGDNPRNRGVHLRKNNHPTVKPIKLMEYLIKLVSREGAIVLDPFIGSGTTAIACLKTNRMFIGIEKEEEYVKIANARIKPFLEQTKLK